MLSVLFLDIDGVLNDNSRPMDVIEEHMAAHVDRIVTDAAPLYVVLSSAWRKYSDLLPYVRQRFVIYSTTPTHRAGEPRGGEVEEWLNRNPDFTTYAILDDNNDFFDDQPLFRTEWNVGLTDEIADDVINHINTDRANKKDMRMALGGKDVE